MERLSEKGRTTSRPGFGLESQTARQNNVGTNPNIIDSIYINGMHILHYLRSSKFTTQT